MKNPYWERITEKAEAQRRKGIEQYGQGIEDNKALALHEWIDYLQEELIDALMYLERIRDFYTDARPEMEALKSQYSRNARYSDAQWLWAAARRAEGYRMEEINDFMGCGHAMFQNNLQRIGVIRSEFPPLETMRDDFDKLGTRYKHMKARKKYARKT